MHSSPMQLFLDQQPDGSTKLRLCGSVSAPLPPSAMRFFLAQMSWWSGSPLELVLPADSGTVTWFESWGAALEEVPDDMIQIRFYYRQPHFGASGGGDVS